MKVTFRVFVPDVLEKFPEITVKGDEDIWGSAYKSATRKAWYYAMMIWPTATSLFPIRVEIEELPSDD